MASHTSGRFGDVHLLKEDGASIRNRSASVMREVAPLMPEPPAWEGAPSIPLLAAHEVVFERFAASTYGYKSTTTDDRL